MWSSLPFDLLGNVFSFLSPDSLARAMSACRNWHTCAKYVGSSSEPPRHHHHPPWFLALPARNYGLSCYGQNPVDGNWHLLSLDFISAAAMRRPIAPIGGGLVLFGSAATVAFKLAICNPFTGQFRFLPLPRIARTNPVVGVTEVPNFNVYLAGGMSETPNGGVSYEPTLEIYDPRLDDWSLIGTMPVEFSVRLTVWTPNESVYSNGLIYWMTSARAYSVLAYEIGSNKWKELSVPMAGKLEFAALVPINGKLAVVGGTSGGGACIWELGEDDNWVLIEKVPFELGKRFLGERENWGTTKCVGIEGAVCLYRDIGSGMLIWRRAMEEEKGRSPSSSSSSSWEWFWFEGCCSVKGKKKVENFPIRGILLHPHLASSSLLF